MGCSCAGRSVRNLWRALNSDDLKKMGAAVDEEASQDDENQSYGDLVHNTLFQRCCRMLSSASGEHRRRREFIMLVGGAAAAWPLAVRAP